MHNIKQTLGQKGTLYARRCKSVIFAGVVSDAGILISRMTGENTVWERKERTVHR